MDYFLIYLWTRLDIIRDMCLGVSVGLMIVFGGSLVPFLCVVYEDGFEKVKWAVKYYKRLIAVVIILSLIVVITPSKKDTLLIYFIPQITHSEFAIDSVDIINKLPKVLQKQINNYLNEESE